MKVLELEVDESVFDKFREMMDIFPENMVKIKEIYDDSHISYAPDDEQKDIEQKMSNKDCHVVSHSNLIKL